VYVAQALLAGQLTAVPAQTPDELHVSLYVLLLLSLQVLPVFGVAVQVPVVVLQAMTLHWPVGSYEGGAQTTGVPVQTPAWHESPVVQGLPSLQTVPSAMGSHSQASATQTAVVQVAHLGFPVWMQAAEARCGWNVTAAANAATAVRQSISPPMWGARCRRAETVVKQ
jgi:hypothetical protein